MAEVREVWFTRCPVPTATGIAADRGRLAAEFAPDGIAVRSLQEEGRSELHFTHEHPGLFREGGNVPALWARSRGGATRLIGLTWIEERQAVLVRPGTDASDLGALRLAVPRHEISIDLWRAMALRGFAGALALTGRSLRDAKLVDVPAGNRHGTALVDVPALNRHGAALVDVPAVGHNGALVDVPAGGGHWEAELVALAEGRVDAVYVKGSRAVEAAARHGAVTGIDLDAQSDKRCRVNNGTPRPITVAQSLLDEHPEIVERFLAVLVEAADWAAGHPRELGRILATETGSGAAGVAGAYRDGYHRSLHLDLSEERLALLADQEGFLRSQGFLPHAVDVHAWADPEPLRRATARIRASDQEK